MTIFEEVQQATSPAKASANKQGTLSNAINKQHVLNTTLIGTSPYNRQKRGLQSKSCSKIPAILVTVATSASNTKSETEQSANHPTLSLGML